MTTQTAAWAYQDGYQAALQDIQTAYLHGGEQAVLQWLADNLHTPKPGESSDHPLR